MNRQSRPEHVLDEHRSLDVATGMRYTVQDPHPGSKTTYGMRFDRNDHTQSVRFRKDDHEVKLRGTQSLNHILSRAEEDDINEQDLLRERINRYDDIEEAAIDIQNIGGYRSPGVIKSLQAIVTRKQVPWTNPVEHNDTAEEALNEHKIRPPGRKKTSNEATQTRIRRHVTKRCYAVSLLYQGVNTVVQDMMRRLNEDIQILSVHDNNDNAPDVLDDANYEQIIRENAQRAQDELAGISETLSAAQTKLKSHGDIVAEIMPTYARNNVTDTYNDVSTPFS